MTVAEPTPGTVRGLLEVGPHGDGRLVLRYPVDSVLVVAGLPGAGKSTFLRTVGLPEDTTVLDPEQVAARLRPLLPGVPYRFYRPLIHLLHYLRYGRALDAPGWLVVHEPGARPRWRRHLLAEAAARGRPVHLLVVRATPEQAREGQRRRGRDLPGRRFGRHVREWARLEADLERSGWEASRLHAEGFVSCVLVPRAALPRIAALAADVA